MQYASDCCTYECIFVRIELLPTAVVGFFCCPFPSTCSCGGQPRDAAASYIVYVCMYDDPLFFINLNLPPMHAECDNRTTAARCFESNPARFLASFACQILMSEMFGRHPSAAGPRTPMMGSEGQVILVYEVLMMTELKCRRWCFSHFFCPYDTARVGRIHMPFN